MTLTEFLALLDGVQKSGAEWKARCPGHDDKTPSLSIKDGSGGKILIHCHGGCDAEDLLGVLGLKLLDLYPNGTNGTNGTAHRKPAKTPRLASEPRRLEITDAEVSLMESALAENPDAQAYLSGRGISMEIAQRLRFGFAGKYFPESGELPAIAMPDFREHKLVGVKYRSTEGRHFIYATGSSQAGLFNCDGLDRSATEVAVVEGALDAALLLAHGVNAVAVQSANAKVTTTDLDALKRYEKIYLIGDMDAPGQKCMDSLGAVLPPEKISRVRLRGVKDIGDVYAQNPHSFIENLKTALRVADIQRPAYTWDDLETESELIAGGTGVLPYLAQDLLPLDDLTMFAGREGSCKTLLALYVGKCVANGAPVFGCLKTVKRPVLYLDAENHQGTQQVYLPFFESIGPEKIRFKTLRYGVPPLTDPSLLRIVEAKRPFLIVDSLIRFCGTRDRDSTEMTVVMEQLAHLVTAGATVLFLHHTRRSDEEEYANSFAIGATVAFWYAITTEDSLGLKRVKMIHKKARGGCEINRSLIAFPHILDLGMFTLDGDPPKSDQEIVVNFVRERGGCNFTAIKKELRGIGMKRKLAGIDEAIEAGELVKNGAGHNVFYSVPKNGSGSRNS